MSKPKHTPGPWFVSHPTGERRRFVIAGGLRIATVAHNRGATSPKANARLMAAAPELLEALMGGGELVSTYTQGFLVDYSLNKQTGGGA